MKKPKNKLTKLITTILFFITIVIAFSSCEAGKDFTGSASRLNKRNYSITFDQFKNETNLHNFKTKIKLILNNSFARNADGSYELSDFDLNTELIKKLELNEKTTYSFRIYPTIAVTPYSFYNLTMYKRGNDWVQSIIEFKPTEANLEEVLSGKNERIDGKMSLLYTSNIDSLTTNNVCYKVEIVNSHCNKLGSCTSESCDGCYGEIGQGCVDKQYSSFCFSGNSITIGEQKDIINQSIDNSDDLNNVDIKNSFLLNVNQIKENAISYVKSNIDVSNQIIDVLNTETNINLSNFPSLLTNLEELRTAFVNCGVIRVDELINLLKVQNENAINFINTNKDFAGLKQITKQEIINNAFDATYNDTTSTTSRGCYSQWQVDYSRCSKAFMREGGAAVILAAGGLWPGLIAGGFACWALWDCRQDALNDYNDCQN